MINAILGTKKDMGQTYVKSTRVPVTNVVAGPCVVTSIKSKDKDGYWAVQLGFGQKKLKNITNPLKGHLKGAIGESKSKVAPRFLREVVMSKKPALKVGDTVSISEVFGVGDVVRVTGTSKSKGFQGVVKRWGFAGSPRTHGQKSRRRSPGSIGQGTDPGRVYKGKKMPGRMGGNTTTVKNLIVMSIDEENNIISLSGPVPGNRGTLLIIRKISEGKRSDLIKEAPQEVTQQEVPVEEGSKNQNDATISGDNIEVKEEKNE